MAIFKGPSGPFFYPYGPATVDDARSLGVMFTLVVTLDAVLLLSATATLFD